MSKNPTQRRNTRTNKKTSRKTRTKKLVKKAVPQQLIESILKKDDAWDSHKTTDQNYDHLGVRVRVNGSTGSQKSRISRNMDFDTNFSETMTELDGKALPVKVSGWKVQRADQDVVQLAQVQRDADGNIVTIGILPDESPDSVQVTESTEFAEIMKERAADKASKFRWASLGQQDLTKALYEKHGMNYVAMAKDKKLNANQLTPAQIERLFQKVIKSSR